MPLRPDRGEGFAPGNRAGAACERQAPIPSRYEAGPKIHAFRHDEPAAAGNVRGAVRRGPGPRHGPCAGAPIQIPQPAVRVRQYDSRHVPRHVLMGEVQDHQGCHKTAHAAGPSREHPLLRRHGEREDVRHPRRAGALPHRAGQHIRVRQGVLRPVVVRLRQLGGRILRHEAEGQRAWRSSDGIPCRPGPPASCLTRR